MLGPGGKADKEKKEGGYYQVKFFQSEQLMVPKIRDSSDLAAYPNGL